MKMEKKQPSEMLELSNQELDHVSGGAASGTSGSNVNAEDFQFSYVDVPKEGGITLVTAQQTIFSAQDLREFKEAGISSPEA